MYIFEYAKSMNYKYTQDNPISCALYSSRNMEIYTAANKSISVWSLKQGVQIRSMSNIMKGEITDMALDSGHRKIYVSDQKGEIK